MTTSDCLHNLFCAPKIEFGDVIILKSFGKFAWQGKSVLTTCSWLSLRFIEYEEKCSGDHGTNSTCM